MLKKDGILTEKYDRIKEYRFAKDGGLLLTTPALEVLEFKGSNGPIFMAYITSSEKNPFRTRYYPDEFWDLQNCTQVFRFKDDVSDAECRSRIAAELNRRADEIDKKIKEYQLRAAELRSQAERIN